MISGQYTVKNDTTIDIGRIVKSLSGRDAGGYFAVLSPPDKDGYVLISDGKLRKIAKPKRKKLRHLAVTGIALEDLAAKLQKKPPPTDRELHKAIKQAVTKLSY